MTNIIAVILLSIGFFLVTVAVIGVLRFPDFYTRIHASAKIDSLGVAMTLIGLAVYNGFSLSSVKIVFIVVFILLTNPISTHLLSKAAYHAGVPVWKKGDKMNKEEKEGGE